MRARGIVGALALLAVAVLALGGCSSRTRTNTPNSADRAFLQDMIAHHQRAVAVAEIGRTRGHDARVRAFATRIVAEQAPELARMSARVQAAHLIVDHAAGVRMATNRISDADVRRLQALHGIVFDRYFLALNIRSELGAAAMAHTELGHGADTATRKLAKAIGSAPQTEIPELETLLSKLG